MYENRLAEVTYKKMDDHRTAIKIGSHRVLDVVDGDDGLLAAHKISGCNDTVYANMNELVDKLIQFVQEENNRIA